MHMLVLSLLLQHCRRICELCGHAHDWIGLHPEYLYTWQGIQTAAGGASTAVAPGGHGSATLRAGRKHLQFC